MQKKNLTTNFDQTTHLNWTEGPPKKSFPPHLGLLMSVYLHAAASDAAATVRGQVGVVAVAVVVVVVSGGRCSRRGSRRRRGGSGRRRRARAAGGGGRQVDGASAAGGGRSGLGFAT